MAQLTCLERPFVNTTSFPENWERTRLGDDPLRDEWAEVVGEITEWLADPSLIMNEDGQIPSKMTIRWALLLAGWLQAKQRQAPIAVVPDGNGSIVFEWRYPGISRSIKTYPDGHIEEIVIRNGKLWSRDDLSAVVQAPDDV
jgi:hypothetical protein